MMRKIGFRRERVMKKAKEVKKAKKVQKMDRGHRVRAPVHADILCFRSRASRPCDRNMALGREIPGPGLPPRCSYIEVDLMRLVPRYSPAMSR